MPENVATLEAWVNLAMNSGLAIIIVVYFLLRDWKFQASLQDVLSELKATLVKFHGGGGNE